MTSKGEAAESADHEEMLSLNFDVAVYEFVGVVVVRRGVIY